MIPRFRHVRPVDLDSALEAYAAADGEGTYYAGGTELLQVMKAGFAAFGVLIDVKQIPELRTISIANDGWLRIGAAMTHREIERSAVVAEHVPALTRLISGVANVRVRNAGTLGGNLAFAEPHSDPAAFLLACEAQVELAGPEGRRRLGIDEFVIGPLFTARDPEEVVVAIHVPPAVRGTGRSYQKIAFFERPTASVGLRFVVDGDRIEEARVTLGSLTDVPILVDDVGAAFQGIEARAEAVGDAAQQAAVGLERVDVVADHNGSADFKRHLAAGLLEHAAKTALDEALARA